MQPVLEWLAPLIERRERFVVLEVYPDRVRATRCAANFRRKTIADLRRVDGRVEGQRGDPFVCAARAYRQCRGISRATLIICLDSQFATTVQSSVTLVRSRSHEPISQSDLDATIAQATWKLFDRQRTRAAKNMGLGDLEVTLADVAVDAVTLDGHQVVNPVGFPARAIGIRCRQTFISRALAARLAPLTPALIVEAGFFETAALIRVSGADPLLFASIGNVQSLVFVGEGGVIASRAPLAWGRGAFSGAIEGAFAVGPAVAAQLLDRCARKEASPAMLRSLAGILAGEGQRLAQLLAQSALSAHPASVYLGSDTPLPDICFSPAVGRVFKPRVRINAAHAHQLAAELGFTVSATLPLTPLASIFGFYFSTGDGTLTSVARRHARWLIG